MTTRSLCYALMLFVSGSLLSAQERKSSVDKAFAEALIAEGTEYRTAEETLLRQTRSSPAGLKDVEGSESDPVARQLARVIRERLAGDDSDAQKALTYLDTVEGRLARTPISKPPPEGVANYLSRHFGDRVAGLLSIHLLKSPDWPHWKVMGVLLYLQRQKNTVAIPALLRFAYRSPNAEYRQFAQRIILEIAPPSLKKTVLEEKAVLEREGKEIPVYLLLLEKKEE